MTRKHLVLTAACAAPLLAGAPSFAFDVVSNGDFESITYNQGQDVNLSSVNHGGWVNWGQSLDTMARVWNPSTTDRWTNANNEFFDTSWGGNDASGNPDGNVLVVRTMGWDYRPSSGIDATTDLSTVWHDDWGNRLWTQSNAGTSGAGDQYEWRYIDGGTPSSGTGTVGDPYAYANQGNPVDGWNDTAVRTFEGAAQNVGAFDATAKYTLTVQVGRLHEDGYNTGATILRGADGVHGTDDDVAGTSSRFLNDAPSLWGGYMVDLLAGGASGQGGTQAQHWIYGQTTDDTAPGYIATIASDDDTQAVAEDGWATVTLNYIPGVSGDFSAMHGQNLIVRLAAKEIPGQHQNTTAAAFDNVVLNKIVAGDANEDDKVDINDGFILVGSWGATSGKTWADGDFTGDGAVDINDGFRLVGNWGQDFTVTASAASAVAQAEPTAGDPLAAEWVFDEIVNGLTTQISVNSIAQAALSTQSLDGAILDLISAIGGGLVQNTPSQVGELAFSNTLTGTELIDVTVTELGTYTFVARWNVLGGTEQSAQFQIQFVPEPASLVLLGLGGLTLLSARRRRGSVN